MANRFDDAIIGDRPDIERRLRVEGGKVMIAVDLFWLAVDAAVTILQCWAAMPRNGTP